MNGSTVTYDKVLKRFPDFGPALKGLASVLAIQPGQQDRAFEVATKARKSLPEDGDVLRTLGQLSYAKKDYRRAAQLLQQAGERSPLTAQELFTLGMSKFLNGQKAEGRKALTRALAAGLPEPAASEAKRSLEDWTP